MERSIDAIKQSENDRLTFVDARDGTDACIAFAKQTYAQYRAARKQRPCKYGKAYRVELVVSCIVLRKFIRANKNSNFK